MNFCVVILILKMEENMQHFQRVILYYFKKGINATNVIKTCAVYGEDAVTDQMCKKWFVKFLGTLTFWPNNSLLWVCLMYWKMFSSTPGLYRLEANSGR